MRIFLMLLLFSGHLSAQEVQENQDIDKQIVNFSDKVKTKFVLEKTGSKSLKEFLKDDDLTRSWLSQTLGEDLENFHETESSEALDAFMVTYPVLKLQNEISSSLESLELLEEMIALLEKETEISDEKRKQASAKVMKDLNDINQNIDSILTQATSLLGESFDHIYLKRRNQEKIEAVNEMEEIKKDLDR